METKENNEQPIREGIPTCMYCGNQQFYKGPEGGMSVNIICSRCKHLFNLTIFPKGEYILDDLHVIDKGE